MLDLKKANKKVLAIVCILVVICLWAAAYLACLNSDAYIKATEYSLKNRTIIESTGKIIKSRLGYFNFSVSEGLEYGTAEFTVVIFGEKENADVYFLLVKDSISGWNIKTAILRTEKDKLVPLETL